MAHKKQIEFCISIKETFPEHFCNKKVLDVGSMDINGNERFLFTDCDYTGLDIGLGPNVDVVCPVHLHVVRYDTIVCVNTLEHDRYYRKSIPKMVELAIGILMISVPGPGHPEHGTDNISPESSPHTNSYYKNLDPGELLFLLSPANNFNKWGFYHYKRGFEMYFWGIK